MIPEAITIGRAVLSVRLLLVFASAAGGLLVVWLLIGPSRDALRRVAVDAVTTAVLLVMAGWKATAIVAQFEVIRRQPLLLLYASGGRVGVGVGMTLAAGWFAWKFLIRRRPEGEPTARELAPVVALSAAAGVALFALLFAGSAVAYAATGAAGRPARVGERLPEFALDVLSGPVGEISDRDLLGQPAVINFWATWCGPCGAEVVDKNRLAREFEGSVRVLGLNLTGTERGVDGVRDYVEARRVSYPILLDRDGRMADRFGVRGTPTTIIVGSDGIIHARIFGVLGYDRVAAMLRSLLDG